MLAIRLQRTGRKGYAQFRVIVQDSHRSPATGKIVEYLGSYNPHTKEAKLDKENIDKYLNNGAQPSNRVAILLKKEGYKLPKWVEIDLSGKRTTKNSEKLRKDQPKESTKDTKAEEADVEKVEEELVEEIAEEVAEKVVEEEAEKIVEEDKVEKESKEETEDTSKEEAKKPSKKSKDSKDTKSK